jgi:hypothetical protein
VEIQTEPLPEIRVAAKKLLTNLKLENAGGGDKEE